MVPASAQQSWGPPVWDPVCVGRKGPIAKDVAEKKPMSHSLLRMSLQWPMRLPVVSISLKSTISVRTMGPTKETMKNTRTYLHSLCSNLSTLVKLLQKGFLRLWGTVSYSGASVGKHLVDHFMHCLIYSEVSSHWFHDINTIFFCFSFIQKTYH